MKIDERIDEILARIDAEGRRRDLVRFEIPSGPWTQIGGRSYINLCGNDYLALASDARLIDAAKRAAEQWGTGAGGSRLVTGNLPCHEELESALAKFLGMQSALLFGSGYHANTGLVPALAGEGDLILSDELNHASLIDGCRLSKARRFAFRHLDLGHLEDLLKTHRTGARVALVLTESIFSMDGDAPDLIAIVELCERYEAALVVDEAHAVGVAGNGRGLVAAKGLAGRVTAVVGTFGKSFGSFGAFVAGSARLRDMLINSARTAIFSTALPPPAVGAAREALRTIEKEGAELCAKLLRNAKGIAAAARASGRAVPEPAGAIIPVVIGSETDALAASEALLRSGILARAIRPPTVPAGTSRLRLTASAGHGTSDLIACRKAFQSLKEK